MEHSKKYILVNPDLYNPTPIHFNLKPSENTVTVTCTSRMDCEIAKILQSDMPDDLRAKSLIEILQRQKYIRIAPPEEEKVNIEQEILDSVPSTVKHKAKKILTAIKNNPDAKINKNKEFAYRQRTIKNSDVVDLITDITKPRSGRTDPKGIEQFASSLSKSLIDNPKRRKFADNPITDWVEY